MATIKLTILRDRPAKDGSYKIQVAIGHKSRTSHIPTKFTSTLTAFKNGQIKNNPDANRELRKILDTYQDRLDSIDDIDSYSCPQLKNLLKTSAKIKTDKSTFKSVNDEYVENLIKEGRKNYAILIERNGRYMYDFCKGDIFLRDITTRLVDNYARWLAKEKGISMTTVDMHIGRLRAVVNYAKKCKYVKYEDEPFLFYKIKSAPVREVDLSLESFLKIKNLKSDSRRRVLVRDLFMLSFYLGGMNLSDMLSVDFRKDEVKYIRKKSSLMKQGNKEIVIQVIPEARAIISKWITASGRLDFGYKFTYNNLYSYISRTFKTVAKELGISENLVFYSARKTFAQFATDLGVPDSVIDYCLGHSDKSRGVIRYYTKIRSKQAESAIKRVVDYTNNPDKYKEYIEMRQDIMMMKM